MNNKFTSYKCLLTCNGLSWGRLFYMLVMLMHIFSPVGLYQIVTLEYAFDNEVVLLIAFV